MNNSSPDISQKKAIGNIISAWDEGLRCTTLSGGAGYGKTYTVCNIVERLIEDGVDINDIRFCAPTGKASQVLNESQLATIQGINPATTIHRMLGYRGVEYIHTKYNRLKCRYLIVDESSMIGSEMFNRILESISDDAKVLFVGDHRQLQPVEPGCPYLDIINAHIPKVTNILQTCHRQIQGSLIANACESVRKGQKIIYGRHGQNTLCAEREDDFFLCQEEEKDTILETVSDLIRDWHRNKDDYIVLAPQWKGAVGLIETNKFLQKTLNRQKTGVNVMGTVLKVGDKVRQTKNNYNLNVFNGFIGRIVDIESDDTISVDYNGKIVKYDDKARKDLVLGYAVSIHSSQGSGYRHGVIICDKSHTFMWSRQLLYVAISRFSETCYIAGQKMTAARAVKNHRQTKRDTYISLKMHELEAKKDD